jgi:hypothetical protein
MIKYLTDWPINSIMNIYKFVQFNGNNCMDKLNAS